MGSIYRKWITTSPSLFLWANFYYFFASLLLFLLFLLFLFFCLGDVGGVVVGSCALGLRNRGHIISNSGLGH